MTKFKEEGKFNLSDFLQFKSFAVSQALDLSCSWIDMSLIDWEGKLQALKWDKGTKKAQYESKSNYVKSNFRLVRNEITEE